MSPPDSPMAAPHLAEVGAAPVFIEVTAIAWYPARERGAERNRARLQDHGRVTLARGLPSRPSGRAS